MNPKNNQISTLILISIVKTHEIEDDNPRQFDQVYYRSVNAKNASLKFEWTRIAMSQVSLLSPGAFGHY